jgi:hypothetical protein
MMPNSANSSLWESSILLGCCVSTAVAINIGGNGMRMKRTKCVGCNRKRHEKGSEFGTKKSEEIQRKKCSKQT